MLAALLLLLWLVSLAQSEGGLAAPRLVSEPAGEQPAVSARGPFTLEFSEAMLRGSVEQRLSFDPPLEGQFTWPGSGDQVVSFWPTPPLRPGDRYGIRLSAGARSRNGRELRNAQTWQIEVRQADVLFLSPSEAPELWKISASGQNLTRLTSTGGSIVDYAVSADGNHIVTAVENEQQGIDLWETDRAGASGQMILPCGADWCSGPAYAPHGDTIAYSRRQVSGIPGRQPEMPRIWLLDRATGSTTELFADPQISGERPVWSPDGRYLAFADDFSGGVRVYTIETKASFVVPAAQGTGIEWSLDGRSLLYLQVGTENEAPNSKVYQMDIATQKTQQVFGEDAADYSVPAWAQDSEWAVVGQRLAGGSLTRQLWLIRLEGDGKSGGSQPAERLAITDDVMFSHGGYQWEPGGGRLVFQRLAFGQSGSLPQVAVWNRQDGQVLIPSEDGFQPLWLP